MRVFVLAALWGCTGTPAPAESVLEPVPPPPVAPAPPPLEPADMHVDVLALEQLQTIERAGWSAGALLARLDGAPAPEAVHADLALLAQGPTWGAAAALLQRELDAVVEAVQWDVVTDHREAVNWTKGNVTRALDTRWLTSSRAHLRLAGVVQRIDRQDLHAAPSCGEVRFVYRLAYAVPGEDGTPRGSRLPLTLNAVFRPLETDCAAWARRWSTAPAVDGVLDPAGLRFDRFEVNAQVLRLPAGVATEPGGQAAYLFVVLAPDGSGGIGLQPLENTPDVARIAADPALQDALLGWINTHAADIDQGTYLLPERFLAERALSWSTAGINRVANRPFSALLRDSSERLVLPEDGLQHIASAAGLIDRLDNGTCTGCHQAGSTAGFHLLGPDDPTLAGVTNRLAGGISPHLAAERRRRQVRTAALASGGAVERFRHHSLTPAGAEAGPVTVAADQPCLPAESAGALQPGAAWGCAENHRCEVLVESPEAALQWGMCVPQSVEGLRAGMSCRRQTVTSRFQTGRKRAAAGLPWATHAYADTFVQAQRYGLPEDKRFSETALNCRPPVLGVPLGRAYRRCTTEERDLQGVLDDAGALSPELCGVVGGSAFDACVEGDFHGCMEKIVGRGMVAACDAAHPCREDHTCQALPYQLQGVPTQAGRALTEAGVGFCTPTYFLFQLRLDGHPSPS